MNKIWVWFLLFVLGLITLLSLPFLWSGRTGTGGYYGMMGPGMMAPSMLGGWGSMGIWPIMGMALIWFIPVGGLVILITGVVSFIQSQQRTDRLASPNATCPNCHKPVHSAWVNCPYCAENL